MTYLSRLVAFALLLSIAPAWSEERPLASPSGLVLLTVSGAVTRTNAPGQARFDRDMLRGFGAIRLRTSTPWTDGVVEFEGVLARDLLAAVGARGDEVKASALNDYSILIPLSDFERYPVIVAYAMNGVEMTRRDKGPLWIIYPLDELPEGQRPSLHARMVWQLERFEVR